MPTPRQKNEPNEIEVHDVSPPILQIGLPQAVDDTGGCIAVDRNGSLIVGKFQPRSPLPFGSIVAKIRRRGMFSLSQSSSSSSSCPQIHLSKTASARPSSLASNELDRIFMLGEGNDFEDGGGREFRHAVRDAIERHGAAAIASIRNAIIEGETSSVVAAETLECLAELWDPGTRDARLEVLEQALRSSSIVVRDAAISGLIELADVSAVPFIQRARDDEMQPELREDLEFLLAKLRA